MTTASRYFFVKVIGQPERVTIARDQNEALERLQLSPLAILNLEYITPVSEYREKDVD